ncbi:unnamed protein product [Spirodela intermedia]|uniref:Uncharacterized protein n=1 Tax=Spirodela intermedia TaxID=51605 RepID=A0A7I8IKU5_SPIIN|nr:unnamed protein product [Spirodela intermedia]CAA6657762.1 unnamed protein product [Spirodela intermedia]
MVRLSLRRSHGVGIRRGHRGAAPEMRCAAAEGSSAVKEALRMARRIHAVVVVTAPRHQSPFLLNNFISTYGKCGAVLDARRMFDVMPQRSLVSYNALISAFSRDPAHAPNALQLLPAMASAGLRPNSSTLSSLLQASSCIADQSLGAMLHTQAVICGFSSDIRVQTALLVMYSTCGCSEGPNRIFGEMGERDAVAWNSIILAQVKQADAHGGLRLFVSMLRTGVPPTGFTFCIAIKACRRSGEERAGEAIHGQILKAGSPDDLRLHNAVLDISIFRENQRRDLVSWNSMLAGFSDSGDADKAWDLFMQLRASPEGLASDEYTFAAVVSATAALPAVICGKPLHALVIRSGLECSVFVGSTLLDMYFKNREPGSARRLFEVITHKDVVLWTDMIVGHGRSGESETAVSYLGKMLAEGHALDSFSLCSSLNSSADLAALKQGEAIHSMAMKTGHEAEMCVCGSLVDMYAKNGALGAAASVFHGAADPDLKSWNAMLGGHGHHGNAEQAFELFERMMKQGTGPDQVTFLSLLSACDHRGLVERGRLFWGDMLDAGFVPGPKHYACMASLLSRAGLLQEAEELILASPFAGTLAELWRNLLSSCVIFRDLQRGIRAANWALMLCPDDGATHILLSNLYASVGRWEPWPRQEEGSEGLRWRRTLV